LDDGLEWEISSIFYALISLGTARPAPSMLAADPYKLLWWTGNRASFPELSLLHCCRSPFRHVDLSQPGQQNDQYLPSSKNERGGGEYAWGFLVFP
jgi:hypothetical protein